jgi:LacI family transcriptional regulator
VPIDIGFATFDELTLDDIFEPSITTVVQPAFEIGARGAEALVRRVRREGKSNIRTIAVDASLRVRASSRPREVTTSVSV